MDTAPQKLRVFVSYGHDEYSNFASLVAEQLRSDGHEVWYDENRLKPGEDWEMYIEDGLEWVSENPQTGRILLIMTPYSVRRPNGYCLNELAKALDNRLKILPVMLVWTTPPLSIYRLQWLDMTNSLNKRGLSESFESDFHKITQALESCETYTDSYTSNLFRILNPLNYDTDLVLNQTWFTGREWVFETIDEWLYTGNASRLFWITGVPGIGKTSIATRLLLRYPQIAAFHICRRGHSEKASPRRAICTIAHQLSTQYPDYKEIISAIDLKMALDEYNDAALFETLITQPLLQVSSEGKGPAVILIDALDEATHDSVNTLANFIASEFDRLPDWVRLIITSRPDKEVMVPMQSFSPWVLDSHNEANQRDVDNYIRGRLAKFSDKPYFERGCAAIKEKSEGVFLYAKHVCDEIAEGRLSMSSPDELPKGLGGVYYHYFHTKFVDLAMYDDLIRPAMELIACKYEPITETELKTLLGWNNYKLKAFLGCMGSFIVRKGGGILIPFHLSLLDWICDEGKAGFQYWVDKENGHQIIADYLLENDPHSEYSLKYLLRHVAVACKEKFVDLFCDPVFRSSRQEYLGTATYFSTSLADIQQFYEAGGNVVHIYGNPDFQYVIWHNHIYFFDQDYYKILRQCGFDRYIRTLNFQNLDDKLKCILVCYYYIVYDIKAVTDVPLEIPSFVPSDFGVLENYRLAYEIMASSYRISGDMERAKAYIIFAMKCVEKLGRLDYQLVLDSVYARILMHEAKYEEAIERLEKAIIRGDAIIEKLSFDKHLSRIQHIRTGSTLILVEQYLNLCQPQKVLPLLKQMETVYQDPRNYDRYWSRYLYLSALYAIQIQDEQMYENFKCLLEPYSLHLSGGRLFYHTAFYEFVKGSALGDKTMLESALAYISLYIEKSRTRYDLELMSEGYSLKQLILCALGREKEPVPELLMPFRSWIHLKTQLFSSVRDKYLLSSR